MAPTNPLAAALAAKKEKAALKAAEKKRKAHTMRINNCNRKGYSFAAAFTKTFDWNDGEGFVFGIDDEEKAQLNFTTPPTFLKAPPPPPPPTMVRHRGSSRRKHEADAKKKVQKPSRRAATDDSSSVDSSSVECSGRAHRSGPGKGASKRVKRSRGRHDESFDFSSSDESCYQEPQKKKKKLVSERARRRQLCISSISNADAMRKYQCLRGRRRRGSDGDSDYSDDR